MLQLWCADSYDNKGEKQSLSKSNICQLMFMKEVVMGIFQGLLLCPYYWNTKYNETLMYTWKEKCHKKISEIDAKRIPVEMK